MVDDALNIRGLKRYAVDHAGDVPQPKPAKATVAAADDRHILPREVRHLVVPDVAQQLHGQGIETRGLEQTGIKIQRGGALLADSSTQLPDMVGVFAGGDCVTGPVFRLGGHVLLAAAVDAGHLLPAA